MDKLSGNRWSESEAANLQRTARRLFRDHGHTGYADKLTRDNCGACALAGYGESTDGGRAPLAPNYAGWARDYVQAGRGIPARWVDAFGAELSGENQRYADALRRDVATFGARFLPENEHVTDDNA
jgi:hypothetical protein